MYFMGWMGGDYEYCNIKGDEGTLLKYEIEKVDLGDYTTCVS